MQMEDYSAENNTYGGKFTAFFLHKHYRCFMSQFKWNFTKCYCFEQELVLDDCLRSLPACIIPQSYF